ncbi:hypothetical protein AGROH133_14394 (plasmid) [Agrobacterium tumefaciens]|nr:hypothetical protein AGROH133_14394 [Agrobacterium tumefaciens]
MSRRKVQNVMPISSIAPFTTGRNQPNQFDPLGS